MNKSLKWVVGIFLAIVWLGIFTATAKYVMADEHIPQKSEVVEVIKDSRVANKFFIQQLKEVKEFYKANVGFDIKTQIVKILEWDPNSSVVAYCRPSNGDFPKYVSFNHNLIKRITTNNPDMVFQIILHEFVHCEGGIGHIQMQGHFMNDGGNPALSKEETKKQFINYLEYYRLFYSNLKR